MGTKKVRYLLLALLVTLLAVVVWYFTYWVKTPQYALNQIGRAVQQHDLKTFEKHVDMETLYSSAYDDVVGVTFGEERMSSPIVTALVQNIKGVAVPILIDQTKHYVNSGKLNEPEPSDADSPMLQNNGTAIVNNLKNKTGVDAMHYDGLDKIEKNGTDAIVTIDVTDRELDKQFLVALKLRQLADGGWQLTKITNLRELISERDKAVAAKLAEINAPVQKQIDAAITVKPEQLLKTSAVYSKVIRLLEADVQLTNTTGKGLKYFTGVLELYTPDGALLYSGSFASNKPLAPQQTAAYKFNWELNPFLADDSKVMNSDFNQIKWQASLDSVEFTDGSSIKLLTKLPDKK